jgi:glutamate N-acetyltransferase/amino-acid N-acetyltransferase
MNKQPLLPNGFRFTATACGIKRDPTKLDLTLITSDRPATAAGVFTQNRVAAAPVRVSCKRVPSAAVRAIVANSGNANACTGTDGLADARRMTELVASQIGCDPDAVLVCSTGVIGERLPMQKIELGIAKSVKSLASSPESLELAARGIMTTDTVPKFTARSVELEGRPIRVAGIAKGAAMIGPNMATMLAFVLSDAAVEPDALQQLLLDAVNQSFNMISVEGHTSTNDTVLALANGAAGGPALSGAALDEFSRAVRDVCVELAQSIVRDAEGAKHFVTIEVEGLRTPAEARQVAKSIADSALVKTAVYGADPNWGRFVSAAGYCGVEFEEKDLSLWLDRRLLYERGSPVKFDAEAASRGLRERSDTHLRLKFELGTAGCQFWTCDLTEEYIKLNADYHT